MEALHRVKFNRRMVSLNALLLDLDKHLQEKREEKSPFFQRRKTVKGELEKVDLQAELKKKELPSTSLKQTLTSSSLISPTPLPSLSREKSFRAPLPFLAPAPTKEKEESLPLTPSKQKIETHSLAIEGPLAFFKKKGLPLRELPPKKERTLNPEKGESLALFCDKENSEDLAFFEKVKEALLTKTPAVYLGDVSEIENASFKDLLSLLKIKIILAPLNSIEILKGKGIDLPFIPLYAASLYSQKPQEKAKLWNASCQAILKSLPLQLK